MIVTRPIKTSELDLLTNNENQLLIITDLGKVEIKRIPPPKGGWSHEKLEAINFNEISPHGWEAYLGDTGTWIGGSEV